MTTFAHIPKPIVATILRSARGLRGLRDGQQPDQWTAARYALAADIAATIRRDHGIVADAWVRDFVFRIAN
jgi:hypothetical protein